MWGTSFIENIYCFGAQIFPVVWRDPSTETASSLLLVIFLDPSFSYAGVRNSPFEICVQRSFKCSADQWLDISWF